MKKYILYVLCILALSWGCNPAQKKDTHEGHNHESHEGHDHAEGEDHDHEGHDHEAEEGHSHAPGEECSGDHSTSEQKGGESIDEIIFTAQQAKASGLEYVTVKPTAFSQVIRTHQWADTVSFGR